MLLAVNCSDPPKSITMFTTHNARFAKRFEAFSTLSQPPHLSYGDYLRGSDFSAVKRTDLLSSAADCFHSAKGIIDWLLEVDLHVSIRREEILALAKVCVTNSLSLHKLSESTRASASGISSASLEFQAHKQYCTMSIKEI